MDYIVTGYIVYDTFDIWYQYVLIEDKGIILEFILSMRTEKKSFCVLQCTMGKHSMECQSIGTEFQLIESLFCSTIIIR